MKYEPNNRLAAGATYPSFPRTRPISPIPVPFLVPFMQASDSQESNLYHQPIQPILHLPGEMKDQSQTYVDFHLVACADVWAHIKGRLRKNCKDLEKDGKEARLRS